MRSNTDELVRWDPGADTAVAVGTELAMLCAYYVGTQAAKTSLLLSFFVFVVFGSLILDVLFPAYYMLAVRGEPASELGITLRHWPEALLTSLAGCIILLPGLIAQIHRHPGVKLLPHLIFNGLILWEPFFVFGWLQLRFERAFGVLPGILLAAASLAIYHIGTFPPEYLNTIFLAGLFYGLIFRLTRNLLALFPFTWAVGSGMGTLGKFVFGWDAVAVYAIVLTIQIAAIAALISRVQGPDAL
jgi:Type II CAAX prenyl endopeptidase Rce1-like